MPRSHIHGSTRRFHYGSNLRDDLGNANFRSPIRMHNIVATGSYTVYYDVLWLFDSWSNCEYVQNLSRMVKDVQVLLRMITDAIRKSTDQYGLPRMMPDRIRGTSCVQSVNVWPGD